MLKGKMKICFDKEREDGGDFYLSQILTFKFREYGYYMGRVATQNKGYKFMLYQDYIADVEFISIEQKELNECEEMLILKEELPICVGVKTIGKGILLSWELV